ncbi:MAG: hypothetical protein KTR25_11975, partial [Myxococcales bacterium]|nr:hypothetical protein [Myxococcales bacterium]
MGWVIREGSFPWNALDEEGAYRAYATDERRSRSRRSPEKGPAKRLTHFSDGLLEVSPRSRTARYTRLVVRAFNEKPASIATHM